MTLCSLRLAATTIERVPTITPYAGGWAESFQVTPPTAPSGEALTSVTFTLQSTITGSIGIENKDTVSPQTLSASYSSTLTLSLADHTVLARIFPSYTYTQTLAAFDNIADFGGTSGVVLSASGTSTTTASFSDSTTLAQFGGTGPVTLLLPGVTLSREGNVTLSGQGAKIWADPSLNSAAGSAQLTILYTYAPVPEPAGLLLLGLGAMGVLCRRSRRARPPVGARDA